MNGLRSIPEPMAASIALLAILGIRLIGLDQPIFENYVGRQIPTAMVARNLDRGSGFLHPQLDTGPFPNLFLVEPPIYASLVVAFRRLSGLSIEASGRIVSAIGTTLGAWGLFGLARRREGFQVALIALIAYGFLPITIRYGRAFQPDALALGLLIAGLRAWDEAEHRSRTARSPGGTPILGVGSQVPPSPGKSSRSYAPRGNAVLHAPRALDGAEMPTPSVEDGIPRRSVGTSEGIENQSVCLRSARLWRSAGFLCVATGLAIKILFAPILIPPILAVLRPIRPWKVLLALGSLISAFLWYVWAAWILRENSGSRASIENAEIWAGVLVPSALIKAEFYANSARFLLFRCFSPVGIAVAAVGWWRPMERDRLWTVWAISAIGFLLVFAAKAHHEYYWWVLAPVVAVGFARGAWWLLDRPSIPPPIRWAVVVSAMALMVAQAGSTWRTPPEWSSLREGAIRAQIPENPGLVVAPEAVLFAADVRGCRLEFDPSAVRRAAGEWGGSVPTGEAIDLVRFYRDRGARTFADVVAGAEDSPGRRALHGEIRRRFRVLFDREFLIADLTEPGGSQDAPR